MFGAMTTLRAAASMVASSMFCLACIIFSVMSSTVACVSGGWFAMVLALKIRFQAELPGIVTPRLLSICVIMAENKELIAGKEKLSVAQDSAAAASLSAGDSSPTLGLTPELWFDPKLEEELAANEAAEKMEIRVVPVREYLEAAVVPLLLHGSQLLAIERPDNPVEFLAKYLIEKNPVDKKDLSILGKEVDEMRDEKLVENSKLK